MLICEIQELELLLSHWNPQTLLTVVVNGVECEFNVNLNRQDAVIEVSIYGT